MDKFIKKYFMFILVLLVTMSFMVGCNAGDKVEDIAEVTQEPVTKTQEPVTQTQEPVSTTKELHIYNVNDETLERQASIASIPSDSEITPQLVMDTVIADFQEPVGVSEIIVEAERIIVCFKEGMAPLSKVGSSMEVAILDCIAYSLLDNISTCTEVVFRGENGDSYQGGHIELELEEAYAWK